MIFILYKNKDDNSHKSRTQQFGRSENVQEEILKK